MADVAARLFRALTAGGHAIVSVSIGDSENRSTWRVQPSELQAAAQALIDGFDPDDPAYEQAELDAAVAGHLDTERIFSALVWAILDTYSSPATVTKYNSARTKIVNAYKAQPWKG